MKYSWAGATHIGRHRTNNEDAVHPSEAQSGEGPVVIAVADGMGGHVAGEVASRVAMERAIDTEGDAAERVSAANRAVVAAVTDDPELAGMGTTLTLGIIDAGVLQLGHVGDSRAYLLRDGELEQVSSDHTYVAELVEAGRLDEDEVAHHPQRNLLTRVLGLGTEVDVDVDEIPLQDGDVVLLCSDGLTTMLDNAGIAELLAANDDPSDAVWALIEAANEAGGDDNITVVVLAVST